MRRFLSWVVLYLASCLTNIIMFVVLSIAAYLFGLIDTLNMFLRILIYIIGGSTLLTLIFFPIHYGSILTVSASEAIKESKKGTRYILFGIIMLVWSLFGIFYGIAKGTFHAGYIMMCIYYIMIIITGKQFLDERS